MFTSLGVVLYEMLTGMVPRGAWLPPSVPDRNRLRVNGIVTGRCKPIARTVISEIAQFGAEVLAIASGSHPKAMRKPAATSSVEAVTVVPTVSTPTPARVVSVKLAAAPTQLLKP